MTEIIMQYYPVPFLRFSRMIKGKFPSAFSELNEKQLLAISRLVTGNISEDKLLSQLTGISRFKIRKLDEFHRYKLMELFAGFTAIKPHHSFIIESIACSHTVLFAPKPKLSGVTFGQFIFAESYFMNYQKDKTRENLHKFVASLYMPRDIVFSEAVLQLYLPELKTVNPEIPEAISFNYLFIREWLSLAYPLIFYREEEDGKQTTSTKRTNHDGWIKIFESLVGDDIVNHERYALLPVHNVFRYMSAKIRDSLKQKK